jgi:hypothetical protein
MYQTPVSKKARPEVQTWWYMPVILPLRKVEIGRIEIQGEPKQKVIETPFQQRSQEWWCTLTVPPCRRHK